MGPVQSPCDAQRKMYQKNKIHLLYLQSISLSFLFIIVKFGCKLSHLVGKESYKQTFWLLQCLFNSRLHGVTATVSFIHDVVAYA